MRLLGRRLWRAALKGSVAAGVLLALIAPAVLARPGTQAGGPGDDVRASGVVQLAAEHAAINFLELSAKVPATAGLAPFAPEAMPLHELALPRRQVAPAANQPAGTAPARSTSLASPPATASFLALGDNNTVVPPDTQGAVGPDHLMVVLNSQVRIQDRQGNPLSTLSLNQFWASLTDGRGVFDPKLVYDPYGQRWVFVACYGRRSASAALLVGVSETADPTGDWHLYRVDADADDATWADFPSLGFNRHWIAVQVNMYSLSQPNFSHSLLLAFDKADLYAGGPGRHTAFEVPDIGGTQAPAITYDAHQSTLYLLQNWHGHWEGQGSLRLYALSGPVGAETFSSVGVVSSPATWANLISGGAEIAPQHGSPHKIQVNDARMRSVVYRAGALWAAHTILLPADAPSRSAVQWWQITLDGGVLQRGRLDDPDGGAFYAFPSLAVNRNGDALLGYNRFSAASYASAYYAFRAAGDPAGTLRGEALLKAGEAPYYKTFGITTNRWGDYSATVIDPRNDTDFWTLQEYAATPSGGYDRWGTWWGRVAPPNTPPALSAIPDQVADEDGAAGPVTLTVGDAETAADLLTLAGQSSNPGLVPDENLAFAGSGASRTLTLTPLPDQHGQAVITVTVSDGSRAGSQSFRLTVQPVDDAPGLGPLADYYMNNDGSSASLTVTVSDIDSPVAAITLTATTSNEAVLPVAGIRFDGSGEQRQMTLTPVEGVRGSVAVTLTAQSGAQASQRALAVHVGALADLSVSVSDDRAVTYAGDVITYTILARNHGPQAVSGATIADVLPSQFVQASWSCQTSEAPGATRCASSAASSGLSEQADLPAGAVITYTVSGVVAGQAGAWLQNTASIRAPADRLDPPENNSAIDETAIGARFYLPVIGR